LVANLDTHPAVAWEAYVVRLVAPLLHRHPRFMLACIRFAVSVVPGGGDERTPATAAFRVACGEM
jgi:hypothetical protein